MTLRLNHSKIIVPIFLAIALTSCDPRKPIAEKKENGKKEEVAMADTAMASKNITEAIVNVHGVGDSKVSGKITFTKVTGGIRIVGDVDGLKPGEHGFHVHEHGDCGGKDGAAAGGHFNPTNKPHGGPDSPERHVGDLGNLVADEKGHAHYDRIDKVIALDGKDTIVGRSIVIHADRDDFTTQPTGASGARIGCGIIEAASE